MSYIRHMIWLTLTSSNPTLLGEQGFAECCAFHAAHPVRRRALRRPPERPKTPNRSPLQAERLSCSLPLPVPRSCNARAPSKTRRMRHETCTRRVSGAEPAGSSANPMLAQARFPARGSGCDCRHATGKTMTLSLQARRHWVLGQPAQFDSHASSTLRVTRLKWRFPLAFHAPFRSVLNG